MRKRQANRKISYRIVALLLAVIMGVTGILPISSFDEETAAMASVQAASSSKLTINTAVKLAYANSDELEDLDMQYETKQAELSSAVRSIAIKKRQMSSFSWSPLLSFHFPEDPDEAEAYEFTYKPLDIQSEIDVLKHSMTDKEIEITNEIYQYFVDIYTYQEKIDYNTERLETAEATLKRNKARYNAGLASEADVEKMEKSVETLENTISDATTSLSETKRKLSKAIGIDISTGYTFQKPYISAEIPRSELSDLTQYTLDNDQTYYESCADETLALTTLKTHYNLFCNHYKSGDMNIIRNYITSAMNGNSVNKKAFKNAYKQFTDKIDSYWTGRYHVWWFIYIPKKWLKDEEEDGTGYIDEDPQVLYSASLEYLEKRKAKDNAADTLTESVRDSYNNYVSARKSYELSVTACDTAEADYKRAKIQNEAGQLTYDEYQEYADAYDTAEQDKLEALADYSSILYDFNRLTCNRVMIYLFGTDIGLGSADGGTSYVDEEISEGDAYYYIEPIIQDSEFVLHVYVPDDYPTKVTAFELWVGNLQVGTRTAVNNDALRHLKLDLTGSETIKIRLYNGDNFVDDCVIDGTVYSGTLSITKSRTVVDTKKVIGSYTAETSDTTSLMSITVTPDETLQATKYRIKDTNGKYLESESPIDIDSKFTYLPLLSNSIDKVIIEFCDDDGDVLAEGTFDTSSGDIYEYNATE